MKKIFILIISIILFAGTASAQKFGVQASYTHDNITWKSLWNEPVWSTLSGGVSLGMMYDFRITEKIHVEPAIQFRLAAAVAAHEYIIDYWGFLHDNFNYSDTAVIAAIPINFKFHLYKFEDDSYFTLLAGPRFNYGLISEKEYSNNGVSYTLDDYDDLKTDPFNMTVGAGISFEDRHSALTIGYDYGVLHKQSEETVLTNNNLFYITYAYYF